MSLPKEMDDYNCFLVFLDDNDTIVHTVCYKERVTYHSIKHAIDELKNDEEFNIGLSDEQIELLSIKILNKEEIAELYGETN